MITIAEHTIEETLLKKGSIVLDGGCRGFEFTNALRAIGCEVTPIDADKLEGDYIQAAITDTDSKYMKLYLFSDKAANFTEEVRECNAPSIIVPTYKITPFWDLIKLDIEGMEGPILRHMEEPLARQISVEFHQHTCPWQTDDYINNIFGHLGQWYNIHHATQERRHGLPEFNYWDVLFILK